MCHNEIEKGGPWCLRNLVSRYAFPDCGSNEFNPFERNRTFSFLSFGSAEVDACCFFSSFSKRLCSRMRCRSANSSGVRCKTPNELILVLKKVHWNNQMKKKWMHKLYILYITHLFWFLDLLIRRQWNNQITANKILLQLLNMYHLHLLT